MRTQVYQTVQIASMASKAILRSDKLDQRENIAVKTAA
jgi:hypothetical protein